MRTRLQQLLSPRSIVIIGASSDPNKITGRPLRNLLRDGYAGEIHLVNPNRDEIQGIPCRPDVESLPYPPELGVVGVPAARASAAIASLGRKGVKVAIVWSSGFGEVGPAGKVLEDELMRTARRYGVRVCGPNTLGLTNAFDRMPLTFSQYADAPLEAGPVAFVSQSGAFGTAVAAAARSRGIGLGYFVSTGNQPDITVASVMDAVLDDPRIRVVVAYMEGVRDGMAVVAAAKKAMRLGKPLVIVKVGRHAAGARAAISHTGALAGDDEVFDSVLRQHGAIRADNETHALDLVSALVSCRPSRSNGGVGLITVSGGAGVMMADLAEGMGLDVPVLDGSTQSLLRDLLHEFAAVSNPVDTTGQSIEDVTVLAKALEMVLQDSAVAVGVLWIQLLHGKGEQLADLLLACSRNATKPFVVCWLNAPPAPVKRLRAAGVCVLDTTLAGIQAAAAIVELGHAYRRFAAGGASAVPHAFPAPPEPATTLRHYAEHVASMAAAELLERHGLTLARTRLARTADEAAAAASGLGFPVAIKIESPDLPHKTEVKGVHLGLLDAEAVRRSFEAVLDAARTYRPEARVEGVLVQAMEPEATELVLGLRRDLAFGPVVMVGLGGVLIEVLRDVVFATPPISADDAMQLIGRLRSQRVLDGVRGRPSVDRRRLAQAVCALSALATSEPSIVELDLNPVFCGQKQVVAVDWLLVRDRHGH